MSTIRNIIMYGDVGFDLTHKHCIDFENESQRDSYFDNLTDKTFFENCNYNKSDKTLNLEVPWTEGLRFTYCSFLFDDKRMFYFVTGSHVVNDKVTGFELQLDVWQTFLFDFRVSEGMVVREHVDRWDRDGNILWTRPVTEDKISLYDKSNTQNLDKPFIRFGEYDIYMGAVYINYVTSGNESGYARAMLCCFNVLKNGVPPSRDEVYKIKPSIYVEDETYPYYDFLALDAVTNGNYSFLSDINPESIMSINYVPINLNALWGPVSVSCEFVSTTLNIKFRTTTMKLFDKWDMIAATISGVTTQNVFFRQLLAKNIGGRYEESTNNISIYDLETDLDKPVKPNNYEAYSPTHEPELYKQPYILRSILDCNGAMVTEINDLCWYKDRKIKCFELNDNNESSLQYVVPIHNKNSITAKEFSELCSIGLSLRISGLDLDIASNQWLSYVISARETDREMLQSTINQQGITSAIGAITGMGGISGMAGSGKGGGLGFNPAQAALGATIGGVMSAAGWMTNNHFGWEQQEIKEKAIRNQPNNLLRSTSGDGILRQAYTKHTYNEQKCTESIFNQAADRYHKYGYAVNMATIPNIRTRKHFNFVETSQIRIEGALNQAIKDGIADIFNNGVTIWHGENITKDNTGKLVLDYSKENIERSLL